LTSGCLIVAFGARGGWKLSPVLVPFGAYIVFILLVWDPGFSPIGWVRFAATFTTSYMAVQSWYQQGNPGASWAAFGGAALMGHTFLDDFGMRVVPLEQVARWTFAMSVRESLAGRTSREHPNSARWVLSGAVVFMAWLAVGRLSTRFLGWMLVSNRPILGALIVATLGWGAAAVLLISIFEVNRRGIPRFVMVSLGVVAAWATWAAVAGVVGNASELALDAAAACGVWALPFFAFFERRAHRPSLAPSRYERNRAWFGAALAAGWALVIGANLADSDDSRSGWSQSRHRFLLGHCCELPGIDLMLSGSDMAHGR
jgi:hypothetical protein